MNTKKRTAEEQSTWWGKKKFTRLYSKLVYLFFRVVIVFFEMIRYARRSHYHLGSSSDHTDEEILSAGKLQKTYNVDTTTFNRWLLGLSNGENNACRSFD